MRKTLGFGGGGGNVIQNKDRSHLVRLDNVIQNIPNNVIPAYQQQPQRRSLQVLD